jgi:hypothetical protein
MARPAFKFRGIQKNSEDFGSFFRTMKCLTGIASNIMSKSAERKEETSQMPRYVVESSFPDGLNIPINNDGARICGGVASRNAVGQVTWVQSFVSSDRKQTFCILRRALA